MKTKGRLEAEISDAIVRFELDYMGRNPEEARTYIIDDLVLVRLRGVDSGQTATCRSGIGTPHGRTLVKEVRRELIEESPSVARGHHP